MMKKIFLFIAATTIMASCSGDSDNNATPAESFTLKVNGTAKTFTGDVIETDIFDGQRYFSIVAAASESEYIEFNTYYDDLEEQNLVSGFTYYKDGVEYESTDSMNGVITNNETSHRVSGTFSGHVTHFDGSGNIQVTLTDGSFNLPYT